MIKMNILPIAGLLCLSLQSVWAMQVPAAAVKQPANATKQERYKQLDRIKPVSAKPITTVPHYVFENCNQVTRHSWSAEHLQKLRKHTGSLTLEEQQAKFTKDGVLDRRKFMPTVEGYDWVHALNLVEADYLKKPFANWTIQDIKKINGAVSRFTAGNPGEFRTEFRKVNLRQFSIEDFILYQTMNTLIAPEEKYNGEYHLVVNPKTFIITTESIALRMRYFTEPQRRAIFVREANELCDEEITINMWKNNPINVDIAQNWLTEQSSTPAQGLRYMDWLTARMHIFPAPETVEKELANALSTLKTSAYSPIVKAALLWYHAVRIHPFEEATKRTGKLLASALLLQNGYLPPLITAQDAQKYENLLFTGLGKSDGEIAFVEFIAELIERTQNNAEIQKQITK